MKTMRRKPYRPKTGDEIMFRLFNTPERKFYGHVHTGKITFINADKTYQVHVESGYSYRAIKRKEIIGRVEGS